ncbi:hypothetical protein RF11_15971 [Thelohanellus kitauei]|uniref:Uncharacterized protein n=1 Tax=Thelohanellus kitauei TaxID=669202 RepID=A0A0C2MY05_THEKT|nr:hypothetical protein RF11_15971 [Thelohanellus kitauei]
MKGKPVGQMSVVSAYQSKFLDSRVEIHIVGIEHDEHRYQPYRVKILIIAKYNSTLQHRHMRTKWTIYELNHDRWFLKQYDIIKYYLRGSLKKMKTQNHKMISKVDKDRACDSNTVAHWDQTHIYICNLEGKIGLYCRRRKIIKGEKPLGYGYGLKRDRESFHYTVKSRHYAISLLCHTHYYAPIARSRQNSTQNRFTLPPHALATMPLYVTIHRQE